MATIKFDQESSLNRMMENFRKKESAIENLPTSASLSVFSIIAEEIGELAKNYEYLARENKWDLAKNYSSLIYQGKFRGYTAQRKLGSRGYLKVSSSSTFDSNHSQHINIPKYTTFSNGDLEFVSTEAITLLSNEDYTMVPVVQGSYRSAKFETTGAEYEKFDVFNDSIENDYYDVVVNGEVWETVGFIEDYEEADKVNEVYNIGNFSGVEILFGNDLTGKKPDRFSNVTFRYVETKGAGGNLQFIDSVKTVVDEIKDVTGSDVQLYCTNEEPFTGGKDVDTKTEIRRKGVDSFKAGNRSVDYAGYRYSLSQHPYIGQATVWGAVEHNLDNGKPLTEFVPQADNVVWVSAYTPDGKQLTDMQKDEIILEFVNEGIKPPCDIMKFEDVIFIGLEFHVRAYVQNTSIQLDKLTETIQSNLYTKYDLSEFSFKQNLYHTSWQGFVSSIEGITHHTSYLKWVTYDEDGFTYDDTTTEFIADLSTPLYPLADNIECWVKDTGAENPVWEKIGVSAGDRWTQASGSSLNINTTSEIVNKSTGEATLIVTTDITANYEDYEIKFVYEQEDRLDTILFDRNAVLQIDPAMYVTTEYEYIN